ncbi:MAG TPA: hypothetical protein VM901_05395 [Bdellovibrionota bacterium]|jgi:hypothetical protein|nr:hypothetical protein [Bdellovibrionota bacterium]
MSALWQSVKIFVRLQWIDRVNTSAFLIGLSIQTAVLCLSIFDKSQNSGEAFALAVRASLLNIIGITLFAAMSSLANDIRFGTFSYLLLSREHIFWIVFKRCLANTVVSFSSVVFPFAVAVVKFPELASVNLVLALLAIFVAVSCAGFQIALVLNTLDHPIRGVPWMRYFYLLVGLNMLPFAWIEWSSKFLPFYWILDLHALEGGSLFAQFAASVGLSLGWTLVAWVLLAHKTLRSVESLQNKSKLKVA